MRKLAAIAFVALFACSGIAAAQTPFSGVENIHFNRPAGPVFWKNERIVEALSLSEEEIDKLTELSTVHHAAMQELRLQIRTEREDLRRIMESEEFADSSARKHFAKAEKLQTQISQEMFEFTIEQRKLLGKERYTKLREMEHRVMEKRHDRRQREM